ncbi:MAG TPA: deoxyguanosinetriphosphate triphosphohydrolase, partial [Burkholderiales bacterium]
TVRRMINTLVSDLTERSRGLIARHHPGRIDDVRNAPPLIAFSSEIQQEQQELKKFLHKHLYQHYRVARMSNKAKRIVTDLFRAFLGDAGLLPPEFQARAETDLPRAIADYVAGMTDRYAIREHRRLFTIEET